MRISLVVLIAALLSFAGSAQTSAGSPRHSKAKHAWKKPLPDRDCVPFNGPYGYYGNPWCDTGSSRPPDMEYRERHRAQKR